MEAKGIFTVSEAPKGVYIFTEQKKCIVPNLWGLYENEEKPVGAIILSDRNLIVALSGSENSILLLDDCNNLRNPMFVDIKEVMNNFNGKEETNVLYNSGSEAAAFCLNYSCGNITEGEWHLPSMGELQLMFNHKKKMDITLAICGGNAIETNDWHWTSTRRSSRFNWCIYWLDGASGYSDQYDEHRVRPVSVFI